MKITYQQPGTRVVNLSLERTVLSGEDQQTVGGNSGTDLDGPDFGQNPF